MDLNVADPAEAMSSQAVVQVRARNLSVEYPGGVRALHRVSLEIYAGETFGIVGESGCGKSTLAGALIGDLPGAGRITSGNIVLRRRSGTDETAIDLATASLSERRSLWGRRVAMVFQDPQASLNPAYPIGNQIDEAVRRRPELIETNVRERTLELLRQVQIPAPRQMVQRYPHQLSGGQQQRTIIALALAASPDLLILDEPTSSLDVTTEATILDLVLELKTSVQASIVFVTHNLAVVAQIADRVGVMYAGEFVEIGKVCDVFHSPSAPYTAGLLSCIPRAGPVDGIKKRLRTIPGFVPVSAKQLLGCTFARRCPFTEDRCWTDHPDLFSTPEEGHFARCHSADEVRSVGWPNGDLRGVGAATSQERMAATGPLLVGKELTKTYGRNVRMYGIAGPLVQRASLAIKDISFELSRGETLGIVGESGCGKTTLVNSVAGLVPATSGALVFEGRELAHDISDRDRAVLRRIQMVFQNPHDSLNPKHTVGDIVGRAIQVLGDTDSRENRSLKITDLLETVGLGAHYVHRRPAELSGGEKQRVAIARALAGNPAIVLADEVTSSLDVSVRAAILNLLNNLQSQQEVSYLFVSHDMSAIRHVSDRVMVLYLGMAMEIGPVDRVFDPPYHPYTEALMSAIPAPDPDVKGNPIRLQGNVPAQVTDLLAAHFIRDVRAGWVQSVKHRPRFGMMQEMITISFAIYHPVSYARTNREMIKLRQGSS